MLPSHHRISAQFSSRRVDWLDICATGVSVMGQFHFRRFTPSRPEQIRKTLITLLAITLFSTPALAEDKETFAYQESDVMPKIPIGENQQEYRTLAGASLQFWAVPLLGEDALLENGDVANAPGFRIRRARIGVIGFYPHNVSLELTIDPLDADHLLHDAHVNFQPMDELGLVLGVAKVPYSRYQLDSSSKLKFYDRPFGTGEVAIGHRVGAALQGAIAEGMLSYVAGVYNASDSVGKGNMSEGILYGGRLESAPLGTLAQLTPAEFRLRIGGGAIFEDGATQDTLAYSGDLTIEGYGVQLRGEYLHDTRSPDEEPALPQTLTAEIERSSIVGELSGFVLKDRLELAFRYETYDSNSGVEDFGDTELFVGGINGYFFGHGLKAILNYIHRNETESTKMDNDALILAVGGSI